MVPLEPGVLRLAALAEDATSRRILFKVWKSRTPYNPTRYLQRLHQLNHPLLKFLQTKIAIA